MESQSVLNYFEREKSFWVGTDDILGISTEVFTLSWVRRILHGQGELFSTWTEETLWVKALVQCFEF